MKVIQDVFNEVRSAPCVLITSDEEGWPDCETYESVEECMEELEEDYEPESCEEDDYNPAPIIVVDNVPYEVDGYRYC